VFSIVLPSGTSPLVDLAILAAISFAAGALGALVGVGGGIFLVPALVLLFGIDIHLAIAASLVSVVGTSSGASISHVWDGLTNLRLGMFLETATVVGGVVGAVVTVTVLSSDSAILIFALVPVLLIAAALMTVGRRKGVMHRRPPDPLAERLRLGGTYVDPTNGEVEEYKVTGTGIGLAFSTVAGFASGLLGIGGGLFKVPAMNAFMNIPFRVASATSTFMIGVTACAGALVYLFAGDVSLTLAAPVALSVMGGSFAGTQLGSFASTRGLRYLFVAVLVVAATLLFARGVGWIA
jgi:hypothetical protein